MCGLMNALPAPWCLAPLNMRDEVNDLLFRCTSEPCGCPHAPHPDDTPPTQYCGTERCLWLPRGFLEEEDNTTTKPDAPVDPASAILLQAIVLPETSERSPFCSPSDLSGVQHSTWDSCHSLPRHTNGTSSLWQVLPAQRRCNPRIADNSTAASPCIYCGLLSSSGGILNSKSLRHEGSEPRFTTPAATQKF